MQIFAPVHHSLCNPLAATHALLGKSCVLRPALRDVRGFRGTLAFCASCDGRGRYVTSNSAEAPHWAIIYNSVTLSMFSAKINQVDPTCSEMLVSKIKPSGDTLQMQWFILHPWLLLLPAAARNAWNLRFWWTPGGPQRYGTRDSNGFQGPCVECVGLVTLANTWHHKAHAADMDLMGCSKRWAP